MDAATVIAELEEGLKRFGTYNYYDKGADSAVDANAIAKGFREMGAEQAAPILLEILDHEHGEPLVAWVVSNWDSYPDFDALLDYDSRLADLY